MPRGRMNSRFLILCRAVTRLLRSDQGGTSSERQFAEWLSTTATEKLLSPNDRYHAEIVRRTWTDRFRRKKKQRIPRCRVSGSQSWNDGTREDGKAARRKTRAAFGIVGGNRAGAAPVRGNSLSGSRVSLVCNVCSRLLPKEWFAKRPMASARANSRVPQPRHLCIIMLRPPLLPRTLQAAPTTEEKSVPLPTLSHPTHPPPAYFASRPSSPSPTPSFHTSSSISSFSRHPRASFLLTLLSLLTYSTAKRRQYLDGGLWRDEETEHARMSVEGRWMRKGGREMNAAAFLESRGESKIATEKDRGVRAGKGNTGIPAS